MTILTMTPTQELLQLAGDLLEADPVEGNRTHLTTLPHVVWYVSTSYSRKVLNVSLPGSLLATLPKQEARNLDRELQHALHGYAFSAQLSRAGNRLSGPRYPATCLHTDSSVAGYWRVVAVYRAFYARV